MFVCACKPSGQKKDDSTTQALSITINKKYLNLPVSQKEDRKQMSFVVDGHSQLDIVIRLAPSNPDYWVFYDVSPFIGKDLTISYSGNPDGLSKIYQDDVINGQDSLYKESNRPQIHFSSKRGWNNDPNGLVYYEGEYHLFYQHNAFEREWENMSWGHAISKDLIHWEELPVVMYPDTLGTIFSGSAVIDYNNTSGFGKNGIPPMIAVYTVDSPDNQRQCIAYSLDKGRTFIKYAGNPILDSKAKWNSKDIRDPAVFWYDQAKTWVMILYERDGNSVYTSANLKEWEYQSHTTGFFECPQFFELSVDGNQKNKKWVMYGASGTYMIGSFDGKTFNPEFGKYYYGNGAIYAAQTFNNIPVSDGRRIQIGWGRIEHPGMPFKHMMLLPTELTLKTTKEGIRMFNTPVKEVDSLQENEVTWEELDSKKASEVLQEFNYAVALRIKTTIKLSHSTTAGLNLFGQALLRYDMNYNQINGLFYTPEDRTSMEISADIIIDKTSVEVFIDKGAFSYALERKAVSGNKDGFRFFGNNIEVKNLKVYKMKSVWAN
ncbi:MAG: 2,6-beta-D-fructofuranosidase [Bacteroidota bacterium]